MKKRRQTNRLLALLPATALAISMVSAMPATANESPSNEITYDSKSTFAQELEDKYIDPDRIYSTDVRWWLGDASHTDETLLEEIQALYDAGFRGVELCMQDDRAADDKLYAYGSEMWTHKWNLMMNKLLDLGMSVSLTSGTNWASANVPGLDPNSPAAMQNLTMGTGTVSPGEQLSVLPTPEANAQTNGASFVTAYAYKVSNENEVDGDSFINLEELASEGNDAWTQNISWTAPSDGTYRVFAIWTQGTNQTSSPSAEPSYTINYFDTRGVGAMKDFWEEHYLSNPELNEKIAAGDVQLFMDSPEINPGGGNEFGSGISVQPQFTYWAEDMADQFRERKGYDITPYLFLIHGAKGTFFDPYHDADSTGTYRIADNAQLREKIIFDFQDVQTQLYQERLLVPLKEWMNSVGIETRAQISYGQPFEISEPIMDVDYPEAENFNQYNQVDIFRLWTGGSKLENKVLSTETGAQIPAYNGTAQMNLRDAYSAYAAGFQRVVWHVWAGDYGYGNNAWPGYDPFGYPNLFRYMGSRNPDSVDYDEFNAHLGRVQQLLRTGTSRSDIGFVHQNWLQGVACLHCSNATEMNWQQAHQGVYYRSTELQDNGYTYDYFSPRFLFDDDVSFNEETKTIEKAGYKALVLYQDWLDLDGAKRILEWAKKGLKVVVLEDAGSRTPFNDGRNEELKTIMDELKGLDTVRNASVADMPEGGYFSADPGGYDDNILEMLQELGVEPYSGYIEPNLQLLTQTRVDDAGNEYVYVYNYDDGSYLDKSQKESVRNATHTTNIKTQIVQDGQFIPYLIDPWTGEVIELANYEWADGKTIVPIDLDYNNIALLAFEKVDTAKLHTVTTNADSAYSADDKVIVRVLNSGKVETRLSDGRSFETDVTVPEATDVKNWDVTVQSWRPSDTSGDLVRTEKIGSLTTTNKKTSTVKTPINVKLETLTTWDQIPEIGKGVSGTGHYEATFEWDKDAATGAYLDLGGTLESSMRVWVNDQKVGGDISTNPTKVKKDVGGVGKPTIDDGTGEQVPLVGKDQYTGGISWTKPKADITPYLVDGKNTIVIDYNSVLSNVQLDRGVIAPEASHHKWWHNDQKYLSFGPSQAKVVPFVEVEYEVSEPSPDPAMPPLVEVTRLAGADRYGTSLAALKQSIEPGKPLFVVTGNVFPDSLSAAPAVVATGGSMIMTNTSGLTKGALEVIKANKPSAIHLIGGTTSIPNAVKTQLTKELSGVKIDRIGGTDRYETSLNIVEKFFPKTDDVFIAAGSGYPDALSGAAAAGSMNAPILVVRGDGIVPNNAVSVLKNAGAKDAYIVGGPVTVSEATLKSLKAFNTDRFFGSDRFATSVAINKMLDKTLGTKNLDSVYIASGMDFPDATSAAALAGNGNNRLFLARPNTVPTAAKQTAKTPTTNKTRNVYLIGGPASLDDTFNKPTSWK